MPGRASSSGSFEAIRASGSDSGSGGEARRRRQTGGFDVGSAHRALQLLSDNHLYGSLVVSDGLCDVSFFFTRGGLRVLAVGRELPTLRGRLAAQGRIDRGGIAEVERYMAAEREQGVEERAALIEKLGLEPSEVDQAAREVIAEVLLDCLFWDEPQFEAVTGEPDAEIMQRRDLPAVTLSLGVADLVAKIQGKIKAVSEVRRTIQSLRVVVEPTPLGRQAAADREQLGEGPVGERRTRLMRQIADEPGLPAQDYGERLAAGARRPRRKGPPGEEQRGVVGELELASLLHELVLQGYVEVSRRPVGAVDLERLRKMEEGIDQALNQLLRRVRAAKDAAGAGDSSRAARHMARAGGILLQSGRSDEAVRSFSEALQHSSEDLEAREGYVQGLWATGRSADALDQSEELGRRYLELNLPGRARNVLERAVGEDERASSLDLLVRTFVKLRLPKNATEAGERLVNRLRREGRTDEARAALGKLLTIADARDRERLLRHTRADRRKLGALVGAMVVIGLLALPAQSAIAARKAYLDAADASRRELALETDPAAVDEHLGRLQARFEQLGDAGSSVAERAEAVLEHLEVVRRDQRLYEEQLAAHLPWREAEDFVAAREVVTEAVKRAGPTLRGPLEEVEAEMAEFAADGERERSQLGQLSPGPQTVERARAFRERFAAWDELLADGSVRIELVSHPAGAAVEWGGTDYSSTTPLDLTLPITGTRSLRLTLRGYEPLERELAFEDVAGTGRIEVRLDRVRRRRPPKRDPEPARRPDPEPTPEPSPAGEEDEPVGVVTTRDDEPEPTRAPPPQVETRDGRFLGERDDRFRFPDSTRFFADLRLSPVYRAIVQVVNEARGSRVYLVELRIYLLTKGRDGRWRIERRPVTLDLDGRRRPTIANRTGTVVRVGRLDETHDLDVEWLMEEAQDKLETAVRAYRRRMRRR